MSRPTAYQVPTFRAPVDLDLSRNEGRPRALDGSGLDRSLLRAAGRYPDTTGLQAALAQLVGVEPDRVLVTAGGDDALLRCFMSRAGAIAVATTPTFEMFRRYSEQTGGELLEVEWWSGDFPRSEFLAAADCGASLAVVVSPNNPTGAIICEEDLRAVAERFEMVIYDAAYTEFAEVDLTSVALELKNVVTVRTLSKAYGLAGLRVGYAVASPDQISTLGAFGSPFPVSGVSALIATQALAESSQSVGFIDEVKRERAQLADLAASLGGDPLPSQGNFVLAKFDQPQWVLRGCASLGVGLRIFPDPPGLDRFVRITVPGEPDDYIRLESALRSVLAPEAILFDLDGVLADDAYTETVLATTSSLGAVVTLSDIQAARAQGDANDDWELTRRLCLAAGVDLSLEVVKRRFEEIYQGDGVTPGLKAAEKSMLDRETIETIARRFPLAIVTGRPKADAYEFLDRFDLTDLFGAIVTREDAAMKPDPAPVRLAMERLGVKHAWMLGDTVDDIAAARGAGVLPIGVIAPSDDAELARINLSEAATVLESAAQLLEVLDGQNV